MSEQITGAQSLVKSLEAAGVVDMFGLPGGAILPAYDPIFDSKIRHILVRHEQGAGHAATGYAQVTGRAGVCIATSGPGATNLVTPLADAAMDSVPVVAITGQVPGPAIGTDAFQEADIRGITMPFTKHNFLVTNPHEIPSAVAQAFHIATTGRPGPVLVDVTKDAMQMMTEFNWPKEIKLPGYRIPGAPAEQPILDAAQLILESKKPVLYVGGGVVRAGEVVDRLAARDHVARLGVGLDRREGVVVARDHEVGADQAARLDRVGRDLRPRDLDEQLVAHHVTEPVVDELELQIHRRTPQQICREHVPCCLFEEPLVDFAGIHLAVVDLDRRVFRRERGEQFGDLVPVRCRPDDQLPAALCAGHKFLIFSRITGRIARVAMPAAAACGEQRRQAQHAKAERAAPIETGGCTLHRREVQRLCPPSQYGACGLTD